MSRYRRASWLLALVLLKTASAQSADPVTRIWAGIQQAHAKLSSVCGNVTEIRTSKLMVKPMVLKGKFCAEGSDRFTLDYAEPHSERIRYNENYLNVTVDGKTEVQNIGSDFRRAEAFFNGEDSIENLKQNFTITTNETSHDFEMKLIPTSLTFGRKVNYLVVKLDKQTFLMHSLEIDGKSGVNSVFQLETTAKNVKLPDSTFKVVKTK